MKEEELYRILEGKICTLERREKSTEDRKTYDEVFDKNTLLTLYTLISKGVIQTLDFPISTGKEGNVFRATDEKGEPVAVKIYRTSTSTYKNLTKYITGDPRFRNIPKDRRGIIFLWAQKEYKNLARMYNAGIKSPEPKKLLKNVLVMQYIGCEEQPAPMLKDTTLSDAEKSYKSIKMMMKKLYEEAQLIHGDLSEYNILVEDEECFLIDVGQSVVLEHPLASELLLRDITNITRYFKKLGVKINEKELLDYIRGQEQ
ncbi:MAG: serine protein kinase RIO [Methanomassiliicoccales archaeon]|nr:MAG: serine protein kinase RIO [Methanomassiliicoccales archaeon]